MSSRGHMMLALIALLLFSVTGLGLLTQALQHGRIERARRIRQSRTAQLRRALTLGLHEYRRRLLGCDVAALADPARDLFSVAAFPDTRLADCLLRHSFSLTTHAQTPDCRRTRVCCAVQAEIPGSRFRATAEADCDMLEGAIPLQRIPLRIGDHAAGSGADELEGDGIVNRSGERALGGESGVRDETDAWLRDTLQLEGEAVDWRALRRRLGMEPFDQPVAPGIYVIADGNEVSCLFVQGGLERLQIGVSAGRQWLSLERNGAPVEVSYTPGGRDFSAPATEVAGPLAFRERILVNGDILCLAARGAAAFTPATRLLVAAAGAVRIEGDLVEPGPAGGERPHLTLLTRDRDFFSRRPVTADVTVAGPGSLRLQIDLLCAGTLRQQSPQVTLGGCLHAQAVDNDGRLEVAGAPGGAELGRYLTTTPYRFLHNFVIQFPLPDGNE